ncbi:MAG: hypothetical protein QW117_01885 [Candidatus Pacearchaeota archaeon]
MRKIKSKKEKEKEEKVKSITLSIILIIILIISTIGYVFFSNISNESIKKVKYNGINFYLFQDNRWHFNLDNREFSTYFNPKETLNTPFNLDSSLEISNYYNKPLYLHFENNKQAEQEILYNLGSYFERINHFCFPGENCSWVEKKCQDGNLLIIKESEVSLIMKEGGCVYLYYKESEDLKVADAFIFKLLKII